MPRPPTVLKLAEQVHADIMAANPEGQKVPRQDFLRVLVRAYRATSLEAAERVLKTGEAAGYWSRQHVPELRIAFVVIQPTPTTQPPLPHP